MATPQAIGLEDARSASGFNRWLIPVAAISVHICIGSVYAWSTFNRPIKAIFPNSPWWFSPPYTTFTTGACFAWIERGFRRTLGRAARSARGRHGRGNFLWHRADDRRRSGLAIRQSVLVWMGMGLIGGIGCGLGYISPVSTLVKWFPDRRGMATGMAIMGFGGGAFLAGYSECLLHESFWRGAHRDDSGRHLLRHHDDWRAHHSPASCGLETCRLDAPAQSLTR